MATGVICAPPILQFTLNNGQLAAGGSILTQVGGVNAATYQDQPLTTPLPNPIPLNSRGEISNAAGASCQLFLTPNTVYTFTLSDAGGNQFWVATYVNGVQVALTQAAIGLALYPQSAAEQSAGVTPTNFAYAPGSVLRYGADPTGVSDSSVAFQTAASCNSRIFDDFPGGGNYIFTNECSLIRYPLTISGAAAPTTGSGTATGGTRITLQAVAGAGKAHFHQAAFFTGLIIERINLLWQTVTLAQFGFHSSSDLRSFKITDCTFMNSGAVVSPGVIGINLESASTFTGAGVIRDNYTSGLLQFLRMVGPCTTVRVRDNEIYGNVTGSATGIALGSSCNGPSFIGNTIEGWSAAGINSAGTGCTQIGNYFEGNGPSNQNDFTWTGTNNISIGDYNPSSGGATYTYNNTTSNLVLTNGRPGLFVDSATINAYRGFTELGLSVAMGYGTTRTFAAGNYGVNTGGPWTVASATTDSFARKGGEMTFSFDAAGTLTGGTTVALTIAIPGGFFPAVRTTAVVQISNGGANSFGLAVADPSANVVSIYKDATGSATWTAGSVGAHGQIAIRIIS